MRGFSNPLAAIADLRGSLFPWVPVFLAVGIGIYFGLRQEPSVPVYAGLAALALGLAALGWRGPERWRPVAAAAMLICLGILVAGGRANGVAAPVLGFRYYGPVEGRIVAIDRSSSDQLRLTLDRVVLERVRPEETPARVRLSLQGDAPRFAPEPGLTVMATGFLLAPEGPPEPGGFDFQRLAWFSRLGAVGYTRTPVLVLAPAEPRWGEMLFGRLRQRISDHVRAEFPGDAGGFATAVLTNDVSGISQEALESLRISNLSHILSISGLHMALVTGFVFATLRYGLALIPVVSLRVSSKKIAAAVGLAAAAFYLGLSGAPVATTRSFIMVAVMLVAVLFDRRAISLRTVAIAALIVLGMEPESLIEPGFQMSFAATVGLVAVFAAVRDLPQDRWHPPRWLAPVLTMLLSSAVAGAATAPFAAAHFNRLSGYGLLANMLATPVMGLLVMPAAVVAGVLAPLGLEWPALRAMQIGSGWVLLVSDWVAGLDGAALPVPTPQGAVLPLLAAGALWAVLMRGRLRLAGGLAVVLAFALWARVERPGLLITQSGGLVGVMTETGRALSKPKGEGFAADSWLENDGDAADAAQAFARPAFSGPKGALDFTFGGLPALHLSGKGAVAALSDRCTGNSLVILAAEAIPQTGDCRLIDQTMLATTGALALFVEGDGVRIVSVRDQAGVRLWNKHNLRPATIPPERAAPPGATTEANLQ